MSDPRNAPGDQHGAAAIAFNALGIEADIARDGFRVYVQPDGLYFIRVGNLGHLTAAGQAGDHVGMSDRNFLLAFFFHWIFLFMPGKAGEVSGKEMLRQMEERPLEERLKSDPANFVVAAADFESAAIRPGGGSLWQRGHGTLGFRLQNGRVAVLQFHTDLDRLIARSHLKNWLGDRLRVEEG